MKEILPCCRKNPAQLAIFGILVTGLLVVWIQAALTIFTMFFNQNPPSIGRFLELMQTSPDTLTFAMVGTAVGAVFAVTIFTIVAVSIPFLQDKEANFMTAIEVSIAAVRMNWLPMIIWAGMIVFLIGLGLASMFLGFTVILPVLTYATWHSYKDMVHTPPLPEF